jgi:NAD(P)-dependent dehydrogenase (short-subunit alcohol dehydrogenase family)
MKYLKTFIFLISDYRRVFDINVWGVVAAMKYEVSAMMRNLALGSDQGYSLICFACILQIPNPPMAAGQ